MRRIPALLFISTTSCVVVTPRPANQPPPPYQGTVQPVMVADPAPAPAVIAYYGGEHAISELVGGGWCYINGQHEHDYYPDRYDSYVVADGFYYWRAPIEFAFYEGHPLPGGGWCSIRGPHRHNYYPPRDNGWVYTRGQGYAYRGPYHAGSLPPANYWQRTAEPPVYPKHATAAPSKPVVLTSAPLNYHPVEKPVRSTSMNVPAHTGSQQQAQPDNTHHLVATPATTAASPATQQHSTVATPAAQQHPATVTTAVHDEPRTEPHVAAQPAVKTGTPPAAHPAVHPAAGSAPAISQPPPQNKPPVNNAQTKKKK